MNELEIVRYSRIEGVNMFFNTLDYRTNHFHDEWEFIINLDQPLILSTATEKTRIAEGELLVLPPYRNHEIIKDQKSCTFLCLQISPDLFPSCPQLKSTFTQVVRASTCFSKAELQNLRRMMFQMMDIYLNLQPFSELEFMSLAAKFLYEIFSHVPYRIMTSEELASIQKRGERLVRFKQFVDNNYRYKIRLADFAKEEGCSLSYISAFIKEGLNMSFRDYVMQVRFYAALKMISQTRLGLQEICNECGFSDYRYFTAIFQEKTGMSPKEFRAHPVEFEGTSVHVHQSIHSREKFYSLQESKRKLEGLRSKEFELDQSMVETNPVQTIQAKTQAAALDQAKTPVFSADTASAVDFRSLQNPNRKQEPAGSDRSLQGTIHS